MLVACAGAAALGGAYLLRKRRAGQVDRWNPGQRRMFSERVMSWREATSFVPIPQLEPTGDVSPVALRLEEVIDDPQNKLDQAKRNALTSTLAAQLVARTHTSPDAYLALIDADRAHRWLSPGDDEMYWLPITYLLENYFDDATPIEQIDLRSAFERCWSRFIGEPKSERNPFPASRFARMGVSDRGMRIAIDIARSPSLWTNLDENDQGYAYWMGTVATRRGRIFRRPIHPLVEQVNKNGGAIHAEVMVLIEVESGGLTNWSTHWIWDDEVGAWACEDMQYRGIQSYYLSF